MIPCICSIVESGVTTVASSLTPNFLTKEYDLSRKLKYFQAKSTEFNIHNSLETHNSDIQKLSKTLWHGYFHLNTPFFYNMISFFIIMFFLQPIPLLEPRLAGVLCDLYHTSRFNLQYFS